MQPYGCILIYVSTDDVFKALADSTRRMLLDRLFKRNGQTINELCEDFDMSRQAVTKHLAILEAASLVATVRRGREKIHYLNPVPINEIYERWIGKYERRGLKALTDLKNKLEAKKK
jgi:DNA-binding transcriptional ArsR family regulator